MVRLKANGEERWRSSLGDDWVVPDKLEMSSSLLAKRQRVLVSHALCDGC